MKNFVYWKRRSFLLGSSSTQVHEGTLPLNWGTVVLHPITVLFDCGNVMSCVVSLLSCHSPSQSLGRMQPYTPVMQTLFVLDKASCITHFIKSLNFILIHSLIHSFIHLASADITNSVAIKSFNKIYFFKIMNSLSDVLKCKYFYFYFLVFDKLKIYDT